MFYTHWALYIGDRKIVHVTAARGSSFFSSLSSSNSSCTSSSSSKNNRIDVIIESKKLEGLFEKVRKNNSSDANNTPLEPNDIVKAALKYVNGSAEFGDYDVAKNNCEHFVNLCRYGKKFSSQGNMLDLLAESDSWASRTIRSHLKLL